MLDRQEEEFQEAFDGSEEDVCGHEVTGDENENVARALSMGLAVEVLVIILEVALWSFRFQELTVGRATGGLRKAREDATRRVAMSSRR